LNASAADEAFIRWEKYPDGMPKLFLEGDITNRDVVIITSANSNAGLADMCMVIRHIVTSCEVRSITLVVTSFMYGTDDRADVPGIVVTAKHSLCMLWDALQLKPGVRSTLYMCEPHTLQLQSFSTACTHSIDIMSVLLQSACDGTSPESVCVVMPDNGADKRYGAIVKGLGFRSTVCNKMRLPTGQVIVTIVDEQKDERVGAAQPDLYILIDDLVRSGGTLLECVAAVRERCKGCDVEYTPRVHVAVVHADFVGDAVKRIIGAQISAFYVTDTNPVHVDPIRGVRPFHVVSVAPAIEAALRRNK
jgi:phosphoribosylpyrophosphate synthetase